MARLITWLCGAVALVLCSLALTVGAIEQPRVYHPSKLEKTCFYQGAWVPCFIRDEALSQQWDV